jgi:hypothetical protein
MQHLKTKLHVMPKVEASPFFSTMLKQRIRKDYRRNQREIIPMILGFERWVPILGIIGFIFIAGMWMVNKQRTTMSESPNHGETSELQYVLEEPLVVPASRTSQTPDTLF